MGKIFKFPNILKKNPNNDQLTTEAKIEILIYEISENYLENIYNGLKLINHIFNLQKALEKNQAILENENQIKNISITRQKNNYLIEQDSKLKRLNLLVSDFKNNIQSHFLIEIKTIEFNSEINILINNLEMMNLSLNTNNNLQNLNDLNRILNNIEKMLRIILDKLEKFKK